MTGVYVQDDNVTIQASTDGDVSRMQAVTRGVAAHVKAEGLTTAIDESVISAKGDIYTNINLTRSFSKSAPGCELYEGTISEGYSNGKPSVTAPVNAAICKVGP